jgi:hypothetical protein
VKEGFGSLAEVRQMDAREVLQAMNYVKFNSEFEDAYLEMSRK